MRAVRLTSNIIYLPINIAAQDGVTLNWFSITLGKKAAKPAISRPSLAPAMFRKTNVGLIMSALHAFGISFIFVNATGGAASSTPWASDSRSFCKSAAPGIRGGKARIGMAINTQMNTVTTNPIHHAPIHTLLLDVRPNLRMHAYGLCHRMELVYLHVYLILSIEFEFHCLFCESK